MQNFPYYTTFKKSTTPPPPANKKKNQWKFDMNINTTILISLLMIDKTLLCTMLRNH